MTRFLERSSFGPMPQLPKVELHLHIDCSLSYAAVQQLAPHVSRAEYDDGKVKLAGFADDPDGTEGSGADGPPII